MPTLSTSSMQPPPALLYVLVATADAESGEQLYQMLTSLGYRVDVATSGDAVVSALLRQSYHVLLLAEHLPDTDGLTLARRIQAELPLHSPPRMLLLVPLDSSVLSAHLPPHETAITAYLHPPFVLATVEETLAYLFAAQDTHTGEREHAPCDEVACKLAHLREQHVSLDNTLHLYRSGMGQEGVAMIDDVVGHFLHDTPELLQMLCAALQAGDTEQLRTTAHKLKGSSACIGAVVLSECSRQIGQAARQGDLAAVRAYLPHLEEEYSTVLALLAALQREWG